MMRALTKLLVLSFAVSTSTLAASPAFAKPAKRKPARRAPASTSTSAPASPSPSDDAPLDVSGAPDDSAAAAPAPDAHAAEAPPSPPAEKPAPAKSEEPAPPPAPSVDLVKLRADYDRLRDELFRARARAALVQEGLYEARLGARLDWKAAPDYVIRHAEVRLDGGTIWDSGDKPVTDDKITVADRPCKPGQHSLTLRLEVRPGTKKKGKDIEQLGYVTEQTFSLVVPDKKLTTVILTGDEDGSLPEYEPRMELELETDDLKK
ncbi:MAG TPA: hypothetical protein VHJ20_01540 [Polyangia bacterium]|nr:hypothetical protein [Polyangia bacterium]